MPDNAPTPEREYVLLDYDGIPIYREPDTGDPEQAKQWEAMRRTGNPVVMEVINGTE